MPLFELFYLCISFIARWLLRLACIIALAGIVFSTGVIIYYQNVEDELPDVDKLKEVRYETPLQIFSSDGKLIGVFGQIKREPASIDEIPDLLQKAFISIEDERFYEHSGFDLKSIARAAMAIAHSGRISQGASTITQQVARNFFLSNEKTVERKIKEIFIAIHIEKVLTKQQILELYLNKVWLGHQAYGVKAAAHLYFNKELKDLTLGEMAILAGMPKGPSDYNPISHPDKSRMRRDIVLEKMYELGHITHDQYIAARDEPVVSEFNGPKIEFSAGYASEMARLFALDQFGEEEAYNRGLRIYTTIDSKVQAAADMAVFNGVMAYDRRHGYRKDDVVRLWDRKGSPLDETAIAERLAKMKTYSLLRPAAVLSVSGREASIMLKDGTKTVLGWEGIKWARAYISSTRQGAAPDSASKVLSPGDLIWVYEKDADAAGSKPSGKKAEPKKILTLAQLPKINSALISLRPDDGQIVAVVGGYSYDASKFNRATQAHRQPGSNFKPFIYSSALRHGFTLASIVNDTPLSMMAGNGKLWTPKNSPNTYAGPIPLREALALSKNVVSVRLLLKVGLDKVAEHVERFGFNVTSLYRHPTLALGAIDITPIELLRGYSAMANGGFLINPYLVDRIEDEEGNILYQAEPEVACRSCTDAPGTEDDKREKDPRLEALSHLPDGLDDSEPLPGEIPEEPKKQTAELPPAVTYAGTKRAKQIISHAESNVLGLVFAESLDGGLNAKHIEQSLISIDLSQSEALRGTSRKLIGIATMNDDILDVTAVKCLSKVCCRLHPKSHDTSSSRCRHGGTTHPPPRVVARRGLTNKLVCIALTQIDIIVRILGIETVQSSSHIIARGTDVRMLMAGAVCTITTIPRHITDFIHSFHRSPIFCLYQIIGNPSAHRHWLAGGIPITH